MKARIALRELAEISASQWGMVTSAQAAVRGVSRLDLSRLTKAGDLLRLAHGIYKDAGAPTGAHMDVRAAWLSSDPRRPASDRLGDGHHGVVVSGQTAAWLHDIGDLRSNHTELTTPVRRQTQRADLHYRRRILPEEDVTIRDGLPVTTPERTIADLVEDRTDLSIVADALRDASLKSTLDLETLADRVAPLAERNGYRKGDGVALVEQLLVIAGIDQETLATQIASLDGIGSLVIRKYLAAIPLIETMLAQGSLQALDSSPGMRAAAAIYEGLVTSEWAKSNAALAKAPLATQMKAIEWTQLARATATLNRKGTAPEEIEA